MSAAPGRPQGSHGIDRKEDDLLAFSDRCNGKGHPLATFYPPRGDDTRAAKRLCIPCPVRQQCLEYALKYSERYGIWGGFSESERRTIRRQQRHYAKTHAS
jgi:hypothetical protein